MSLIRDNLPFCCTLIFLQGLFVGALNVSTVLETPNFSCGEPATITCTITNGAGLTTYWYQIGKEDPISIGCNSTLDYITIDERCSESEEFYAIQIEDTGITRDNGNWTCVYGEDNQGSDSFILSVTDIPKPPNATLVSGEVVEGQSFDIKVEGDCAYPEYNIVICFHEQTQCFGENTTCSEDCGPFQKVSSTGTEDICNTDDCDEDSFIKNVTFSATLKEKFSDGVSGYFYFIYAENGWENKVNRSQAFPYQISGDDSLGAGFITAMSIVCLIGVLALVGGMCYLFSWRKGFKRG